jgi:pilus assembly protein CpaB
MLALGCGLIASIGITRVMAKRSTDAPEATVEMEAIYVALEDIPTGDKITAELIKLEEWPVEKVPDDALRDLTEVVDQHPKSRIYAGQPILRRQLNEGSGATAHIPEGYRVVPVKVDAKSGGSGMIRPGDRVDVAVHLQKCAAKSIPRSEVRLVLQDVKVFAVNDVYEAVDDTGDQIKAQTISLLVTPPQAQKLILAEESGKIRCMMRGVSGDGEAELAAVSMDELLGGTEVGDREKESEATAALNPAPASPNAPPEDFLKFLEDFGQGKPDPAADPFKPAVQWRMRVISADEVRDEVMELDAETLADNQADGSQTGKPGGFSRWTLTSGAASPSAAAAEPATAPPAEEQEETPEEADDAEPDGPELGPDDDAEAPDDGLANRRE